MSIAHPNSERNIPEHVAEEMVRLNISDDSGLQMGEHIVTEPAQPEEERYIVPEGDERCGEPKEACTCMLRKGHEGNHRCTHGYWMARPLPTEEETR